MTLENTGCYKNSYYPNRNIKTETPAPKSQRLLYEIRFTPIPKAKGRRNKTANGAIPISARQVSAKKIPAAKNIANRNIG